MGNRTIEAKVVVFDFDGTIVDSNSIKQDAFFHVGNLYNISAGKMRSYLENIKGDRYVFFNQLEKMKIGGQAEEMIGEFTSYCQEKVVQAPPIKGAMTMLTSLKSLGIPLYILSATPQMELQAVVKERKIDHFFKEIIGVENEKGGALKELITRIGVHPDEVLFVGDQLVDLNGANEAGAEFIAIDSEGSYKDWGEDVCLIDDYSKMHIEIPDPGNQARITVNGIPPSRLLQKL